ncbi:MAG: TlyA family RNA methyltransferase [Maricaulaceae bacterium]
MSEDTTGLRADKFLVAQGYFDTRTQAQAAIKAGKVRVNGRVLKKASTPLSATDDIKAGRVHPWASRGGIKLDHALKSFKVNVEGLTALDVGASTGGFTDVLLTRGAGAVYAVDVGHDQLHDKLKNDPRVLSLEGQDARKITKDMFPTPPDIIVCDASFISATKVLDVALDIAVTGTKLITLVKPQFEVGREGIGRGGLVKSKALADQALSDVSAWVSMKGWQVLETLDSPIKGGSGNAEFLLYALKIE